jgi:hypothetical protein
MRESAGGVGVGIVPGLSAPTWGPDGGVSVAKHRDADGAAGNVVRDRAGVPESRGCGFQEEFCVSFDFKGIRTVPVSCQMFA